jgi:hypothetical protein
MNAMALFTPRFGTAAMRLLAAFAMAFLLAGTLAHSAGATEMDKGAFKTGCESGGGSFVENADGSFQCNLKSGGTIKCPDTKSQCTYTALVATTSGIVLSNSVMDAGPAVTPTPTRPVRSNLGNVVIQSSFSVEAPAPTGTPAP